MAKYGLMAERRSHKILAVIPARGGSKGLPRKNVLPLSGKPLIGWTIEAVKESKNIDRIVVSTDDREIASACEKLGVRVPYFRPKKLAKDDTPAIDVVVHVLERLKTSENYMPDYVALFQPTSPLRTSLDIDRAVELLFSNSRADSVISLVDVSESPYWMRTVAKDGFIRHFMRHDYKDLRRQDLPPVYIVNGAIYISKTDVLLKNGSFSSNRTIGYLMPRSRSIDIDDMIDFRIAEMLLAERLRRRQK